MDETKQNTFNKSKLIILLAAVFILLAVFLSIRFLNKSDTFSMDEKLFVSDPEAAREIARLKSEQETVLFESKDKAPVEYLLNLPVETNPVEIELSRSVKNFAGTEDEIVFVNYVYYSILSRNQIINSFKSFLSNNNYSLEEFNEDRSSSVLAKKEGLTFSIIVTSIQGGLSYVKISLTIK